MWSLIYRSLVLLGNSQHNRQISSGVIGTLKWEVLDSLGAHWEVLLSLIWRTRKFFFFRRSDICVDIKKMSKSQIKTSEMGLDGNRQREQYV